MKTWIELLAYCRTHSNTIFVRYQMNDDGEWGNYPLSQIPFADAIDMIENWFVDEERVPHRIVKKKK